MCAHPPPPVPKRNKEQPLPKDRKKPVVSRRNRSTGGLPMETALGLKCTAGQRIGKEQAMASYGYRLRERGSRHGPSITLRNETVERLKQRSTSGL